LPTQRMARNKANGVATLGPNGIRLAHPVHDLFAERNLLSGIGDGEGGVGHGEVGWVGV
jgi:hypothetical protein